jgi:hypothetical protein
MNNRRVFRVFEVATVDQVGSDSTLWRVQGRAWEDVHIGDTVSLDVVAPNGEGTLLTFQVMQCRSYGVDITEVSHGMTGELLLQGPYGDLLQEDDVLLAE